jgi:hypothetical protein
MTYHFFLAAGEPLRLGKERDTAEAGELRAGSLDGETVGRRLAMAADACASDTADATWNSRL